MINITCYVDASGYLCCYRTGETIRLATDSEREESAEAGETGAIEVVS